SRPPRASPASRSHAASSWSRRQDSLSLFSIFTPEEAIRFRGVRRAQLLVVPFDLLARAIRDVPQVVRFRRPPRVLEVRTVHGAEALCVIAPLDPVTG